jgi:hypothetical protein
LDDEHYLTVKTDTVFLLDYEDKRLWSCKVTSLDSFQKKKQLAELTNQPEKRIDEVVADLRWSLQEEPTVEQKEPDFTPSADALAKAKELSKDPAKFFHHAQKVLETKLAGEYQNRLFVLLACVCRHLKTTIIRIYGPNSAGKKMLYYWIPDVFGNNNVVVISSASAAWLKRKVMRGFNTKGKIFILIEDRGDPQDALRYQFEQIYSEDKIRLGLNVKSDDGEWEPVEIELQGPCVFITTSTELEESFHAQTRAWEVNPDESKEQSALISQWFRWRELRSITGIEQEKRDLEVLTTYLTNLREFNRIVIPYIDQVKFDYQTLADRRKLPDFTILLKALTFLFPSICPKDEENKILYSVPFVFDLATYIAGQIIAVSRGRLNRGEQRVFDFISQHFDEIKSVTADGRRPTDDHMPEGFLVADICPSREEFKDIHDNTMRNWLNGLTRKGLLKRQGMGRGKPAVYIPIHNNLHNGLVNLTSIKNDLIPELEAVSAQNLEVTSTQITMGLPSQPILKPSFTDTSIFGCDLVNYRIEPEMLDFHPEWLKTANVSSQTGIYDLGTEEGQRAAADYLAQWCQTLPLARLPSELVAAGYTHDLGHADRFVKELVDRGILTHGGGT